MLVRPAAAAEARPWSPIAAPTRLGNLLFWVLGCWALLSVLATPLAAEPLLVDLFFDVAENGFEAAGNGGLGMPLDNTAGAPSEVLIAGIPVRLGEHYGPADDGWRTIAGARGQHTMLIGDRLTMSSSFRVARTDFVADSAPGKVVASAATDLRYALEGWTLSVRPGLELARWETDLLQRDSSLEARLSKALGGGVSLASTVRYLWRDSTADQSDVEIAFGRLAVVCRLPQQVRLEMAYLVRQEIAAESTLGTGPSVAVMLPLIENVDLTARYDLTRTTRYQAAAQADALSWNRHHVGLGMTWAPGGASDIKLSAGYRYEHGGAAVAQRARANHAATVSFALHF